MTAFRYRAVDGQRQVVVGEVEAATGRAAARALRQQGLAPLEVTSSRRGSNRRRRRNEPEDRRFVIQELATLLKAGVSLAESVQALAAARSETNVGDALVKVDRGLRSGDSFSQSLRTAGLSYPEYVFQLCHAGELTGRLDDALRNAAAQMAYQARIRQEVRNALIYPSVLVVAGISATLVVFIFVVPKFAKLLQAGHADIPLLSRWIIETGLFFNDHIVAVGLIAVAVALSAVALLRNPVWINRGYAALARAPLVGAWLHELDLGRWASLLAALLQSRVALMQAMELAENSIQISSLRSRLGQVRKDVRSGKRLADALEATRVLDATGLNLVRVGERSGELPAMFRTLSEIHEEAGSQRMKRFLLLLEPIAILVVGSVIGTIMVAIMLAITSISNVKF